MSTSRNELLLTITGLVKYLSLKLLLTVKGGENVQKNVQKKLIMLLLTMVVVLIFCGSASAADLNLTTGSWNTVGLDSNNVNDGPNLYIIQTHVTNNGTTTAKNISATINLQNTGGTSYINLKTGENTTKYLGDIAPGETKDLFYQIEVTRHKNAYGTSRGYTINVFEDGTSTGTMTGTLRVVPKNNGLIDQERNEIISINASNTTPQVGDIFTVTVVAKTSSSNYDFVELPLIQYDPTKIQPISYLVSYGSSTSNNLLLVSPGTNYFTCTWTLKALASGNTPVIPFIVDKANNAENYHYNKDFGQDNLNINVVNGKCALAVTKVGLPGTVNAGELLTYTMVVTNNGPSVARNVSFVDMLPVALTGAEYSLDGVNWLAYVSGQSVGLGDLNVGATKTFYVRGIVNATTLPGTITNAVQVFVNGTLNNQTSATNTVTNSAALNITKTPDKTSAQYNVGETIIYTIIVRNDGPSTAHNVVITDTIPDGLQYAGASDGGSLSAGVVTWNVGDLASGAQITRTVNVTVLSAAAAKTIVNTANAICNYMEGPVSATASIYVPSADLVITKTVDNAKPVVKDTVHFTMIVNNHGPDTSTDVKVTDKLPHGLTFVKYTASTGTYDPSTGVWTIGNLTSGATAWLNITATVDQIGMIINEANITALTYDPNLEGNSASASVDVQQSQSGGGEVTPPNGGGEVISGGEAVSAAYETIPMQETGVPIGMILTALLMLLTGFVIPRKK